MKRANASKTAARLACCRLMEIGRLSPDGSPVSVPVPATLAVDTAPAAGGDERCSSLMRCAGASGTGGPSSAASCACNPADATALDVPASADVERAGSAVGAAGMRSGMASPANSAAGAPPSTSGEGAPATGSRAESNRHCGAAASGNGARPAAPTEADADQPDGAPTGSGGNDATASPAAPSAHPSKNRTSPRLIPSLPRRSSRAGRRRASRASHLPPGFARHARRPPSAPARPTTHRCRARTARAR